MNCGAETTCILAAIAITVVLYMHFVKGSTPSYTASKCASARQGMVDSDEECYEKEALKGYDYDDDDCDEPKAEGNPSDCKYKNRVNAVKRTCKANKDMLRIIQTSGLRALDATQEKRAVDILKNALEQYA